MAINHFLIAEFLTEALDNKFQVGRIKFGLDPILGLIPGVGDFIPFLLSLYIIWVAKNMNVPKTEIKKMWQNVTLDLGIGLIPFVGDIGDFVFKANSKNMQILRKYRKESIETQIIR